MDDTSIIIIVVFAAVIIGYLIVDNQSKKEAAARKKLSEKLLNEYNEALQSNDKRKALEKGRKYYGNLRNGKLTTYDELAIANDLSVMLA